MTAPPFDQNDIDKQVFEGLAQIYDALAIAPQAAREEAQQVLSSEVLVERVVDIVEPRFKRQYWKIIAGVGVLLTLVIVLVMLSFQRIAEVAATNALTNTDQDAAISRSLTTIQAFRQQLDDANQKLVAQGLPPVQAPAVVQPGTPAQAQLSVAAATANTLAALPETTLARPTAATLAAAVADYMRANPQSVDPQAIITAVSTYFATHSELRGPAGAPGPAGPVGPAPSANAINEAFRDEISANPNLLCPGGGAYGSRTLALAGGGTVEAFGCYGNGTSGDGGNSNPGNQPPTTNPPTTTTPPTQPPDPGSEPAPTASGDDDPTTPPQSAQDVLGDLLGVDS